MSGIDQEVQQAREVMLRAHVLLEERRGVRRRTLESLDRDVAAAEKRLADETAILRDLVEGRKATFEDYTAPPNSEELSRIRKAVGAPEPDVVDETLGDPKEAPPLVLTCQHPREAWQYPAYTGDPKTCGMCGAEIEEVAAAPVADADAAAEGAS